MKTGHECLCISLPFSKHIVALVQFRNDLETIGMVERCDFVPHLCNDFTVGAGATASAHAKLWVSSPDWSASRCA